MELKYWRKVGLPEFGNLLVSANERYTLQCIINVGLIGRM